MGLIVGKWLWDRMRAPAEGVRASGRPREQFSLGEINDVLQISQLPTCSHPLPSWLLAEKIYSHPRSIKQLQCWVAILESFSQ